MQAVILVGGFGTRMRPLTNTRPKPLIPFANEPLLVHTLRRLAAGGVTQAILSTGYLSEAFEELVPLGQKVGVEVILSVEQSPMGTSGAVKLLEDRLADRFLVLNGDVIADVDYAALLAGHGDAGAAATLALVRVPDPSAFGLVPVDADGRVQAFLEKPGPDDWVTDLINAGVYVLQRDVLGHVGEGPSSFERNLFPSLLAAGELVRGEELSGYWRDLGTPAAYRQAQFDLLEGRLTMPVSATERARGQWFAEGAVVEPGAVLRGSVLVGEGAHIASDARVFGPAILGPGVRVAGGGSVESSVLLEGARVEPTARVVDAIIGANCVISSGATVRDGAVLGDDVTVEGENVLGGGVRVSSGVHLGPGAIQV